MISKLKKELQNKKRDNKGAALIMVIIAIAFVGMLVAMVLYMAYCSYLMKSNDTQAKDNFYSAEYALDVINAGLQHDISECMSEAYVLVTNNSLGNDSETMELEFQNEYTKRLQEKLQDKSGPAPNPNKWDINYLKKYWGTGSNQIVTVASIAGDKGAYLGTDGTNKLEISANGDYLTLYDLEIVYTDDKGFISIIHTDIRLRVPTIGFAQSASKMNIENFSLIANDSLINDSGNTDALPAGVSVSKGGMVNITGNVFGGYDGVQVANQNLITFVTDPADAASPKTYHLIADSLNVENALNSGKGLFVNDTYETYVSDINVRTGRLDLDGKIYAGDDLDVAGKESRVTLAGEYYGYGNTLGQADGSSSILVNGGDTYLDFENLDKLLLSGHAYVGATKYDADKDRYLYGTESNLNAAQQAAYTGTDMITDMDKYQEQLDKTVSGNGFQPTENTIPQNTNDFMMGESISVKANQLLYLVPPECIGYEIATGKQVIAKNPMTYDEYQKLLTQVEKENVYDPVRIDKLWAKLGGVSYTNDYKAVYRRVNGTVLVYIYLDFGVSETMANAFFKAYYDYDKEGIDNYVNSYIDTMKWNPDLDTNLTLAGNAFRYDRATKTVTFLENDLSNPDTYANMLNLQTEYANVHFAMMHSLDKDINELTSTQQSSEIYDSLVDAAMLTKFAGLEFKDSTGNIQARFADGSIVYPSTKCPSGTQLIVAKDDIYINENFKGLAIAGGNIYVCNQCSWIQYDPATVLQAMRTKATKDGTEHYAYEVFGASGVVSYANTGTAIVDEKIGLSELILYQNWKKE